MSITIDIPPAIVQKANDLAESRNTTISQLFREYINFEFKRRENARVVMERLEAIRKRTSARLTGKPYTFKRADAYEPETPYA